MLVTDVVGHAIQPGCERGIAAEGVAIAQHAKKRVLHEIVDRVGAAREAIAEGMHPRVVPLEEQTESVHVSVAHGAHNRFVGCVFIHARKPRVSAWYLMTEQAGRIVTPSAQSSM